MYTYILWCQMKDTKGVMNHIITYKYHQFGEIFGESIGVIQKEMTTQEEMLLLS